MRLKNLLKAGIFNLIFQFLFLIFMFLLGFNARIESDPGIRFLILTGLVFVPALLWAGFFYLQDRREPEPVPYILASFATGMAIWALLGYPLVNILFQTGNWIYASVPLFVLGSFFIHGSVFSLLLFGFLRLVFMPLKEFDEPVDGMVYGAVVGAGYASVKSMQTLWASPDYTLFAMAAIITTQILIYSAVGSIMGYLVGQAKFQKRSIPLFSILGISLGMVLLGTYHVLNEFFFLSGFTHAFWFSFGFTVLFTLVIFSICVIRMRHLTAGKREKPRHSHFILKPAIIIYSLVLLLIAGVISDTGNRGRKYISENHGISFFYPHTLSFLPFQGLQRDISIDNLKAEILFIRQNIGFPVFQFSLEVRNKASEPGPVELNNFIPKTETESLLVENTVIGQRPGKRISYSYLDKSKADPTEFPVLIKVITDIVPVQSKVFVFTFRASDCHFEAGRRKYRKIISSVRWETKR
jgi:RsiW-degrading membrane proteinase PrsW (M82 family)